MPQGRAPRFQGGESALVIPLFAALIARRAMGGTGDHGHDIAVIDLVLHMYSRAPTRRRLSELWCVAPPGSRRFF